MGTIREMKRWWRVFFRPAMVLHDSFGVCSMVFFHVVSSLYNIDAVESFNDSKVIEWVRRVALNFLSGCFACCYVICGNDKIIIYLS